MGTGKINEQKKERKKEKEIHMITDNQGDKKSKSGSGKKKERIKRYTHDNR